MSQKKPLKVIVRGGPDSGKTSTAAFIKMGLVENGYKGVVVKDIDPKPFETKADFETTRLPRTRERGVVIQVEVEGEGAGDAAEVVLRSSRFISSLEPQDVEAMKGVIDPDKIVLLMELAQLFVTPAKEG